MKNRFFGLLLCTPIVSENFKILANSHLLAFQPGFGDLVVEPKIHLRRRNNPMVQFWSEENISVTDIAKISFRLKIPKNLFGLYI
ncbi:hypothetical protein AKJ57_02840 [candidate division MSBL1 archaeon SCGC-AAA259A05]|uniref:Uncharacterized protein n=1 Tax=candidate division MSBL1 archaeon SCGC-AAA259A05 TaxID=1698259 RepID=A0A133U9X1_9EURY|nr:hypothetical protein AKJ57_02840 [candidate division MSBL1 archaeon SCGC-AAA259A05]